MTTSRRRIRFWLGLALLDAFYYFALFAVPALFVYSLLFGDS